METEIEQRRKIIMKVRRQYDKVFDRLYHKDLPKPKK